MLVILDKDGTLVKPRSGATFVQSPADQELLPGVAERIAEYKAQGATIVVASNQGGIEKGYKSIEATIAEMQYLMELLSEIESCYFCPDFRGSICFEVWRHAGTKEWLSASWKAKYPYLDFRKPNNGMLTKAMEFYGFLFMRNSVLMVGDRPEDEQAAIAAGVQFQWADDWRKTPGS